MQSRGKRGQMQMERMDDGDANTTAAVGKPPSILHLSKSKQKLPIEPPEDGKAAGMTV
jgi:hypothetical protein